jgi:cell division protein FtsB
MASRLRLTSTPDLDDAARRRAERKALAGNIRRSAVQPDGGAGGGSRTGAPQQRALTGRLLIILALLLFSVMLIAPQMRVFMNQHAEVSQLQADIEAQKLENEQLTAEAARYKDDAFVKQQARDRLFMVMPGETRYLVAGTLPDASASSAETQASRSELPWNESYTDAVRQAAR